MKIIKLGNGNIELKLEIFCELKLYQNAVEFAALSSTNNTEFDEEGQMKPSPVSTRCISKR